MQPGVSPSLSTQQMVSSRQGKREDERGWDLQDVCINTPYLRYSGCYEVNRSANGVVNKTRAPDYGGSCINKLSG